MSFLSAMCVCVCVRTCACVYSMCALKRLRFLCVDLRTCWHSSGFLCHAIAECTIKLASDSRQSMLSLVPLALLLLGNLSSVIHLLQNVAQEYINIYSRLDSIVSDTSATWRSGIHPLHYLPSAPNVFLLEFSPVFPTHKLYLGRAPAILICTILFADPFWLFTLSFFSVLEALPLPSIVDGYGPLYSISLTCFTEREMLYRGP